MLLWDTLSYSELLWATLGYSGLLWATLGYSGTTHYHNILLKHFFDNVLLDHVGLVHVLPLAVHLVFYAEQVEGVILINF